MSNFHHPLVKPQIVVPHKIVGIPVNSGISLKCRIEASPKPITVWSRKKGLLYNYTIFLFFLIIRNNTNALWIFLKIYFSVGMLVPSPKYNVEEIELSSYRYISILRMSALEADDFDEYKCVSENTIGRSEAVMNVYGKTWSKWLIVFVIFKYYCVCWIITKHTLIW